MRLTSRWPRLGSPRRAVSDQPARDDSLIERGLVDAAVDSYARWRERSAAVRDAYRVWCDARSPDRSAAFSAYAAAVDREQRAGDRYAKAIDYYLRFRRTSAA